jgi:hypothetical protein
MSCMPLVPTVSAVLFIPDVRPLLVVTTVTGFRAV